MTATENLSTPQRAKSVTITAWLFVLIGTFTTIASMIQGLMYVRMLTMPTLHQAMHEGASHLPFVLQLLFEHFRLYLLFVITLSLSTLISAIGLLKRKNWARKLFIGVLVTVAVAMLIAFVTQLSIRPASVNIPDAQIPAEAKKMMRAMKGFFFIVTFTISCLFGWLIAHLTNPEIRQEFLPEN